MTMTAKNETTAAPVSHRIAVLRRHSAACSCGAEYVTEATDREEAMADLRGQHRDHKLNPAPAKPARKPRARKPAAKV